MVVLNPLNVVKNGLLIIKLVENGEKIDIEKKY